MMGCFVDRQVVRRRDEHKTHRRSDHRSPPRASGWPVWEWRAWPRLQPAGPLPDYHWCPGQFFDPHWGPNWDQGRCHDDNYFDGEPHDAGHWHGTAPGTREPAHP